MNSVRAARRFFLHPFWLFLALPGYVGWRLLSALGISPVGAGVGVAALVAFCLFIPFSMRSRAMLDRRLADRVAWVGFTAMGFFSTLLVLTLLREVVLAIGHILFSRETLIYR